MRSFRAPQALQKRLAALESKVGHKRKYMLVTECLDKSLSKDEHMKLWERFAMENQAELKRFARSDDPNDKIYRNPEKKKFFGFRKHYGANNIIRRSK